MYTVLGNKVLIEGDDPQERSKSGIYITETFKELPPTGTVVEVGPKVTLVKKGDRVVFFRYAAVQLDKNEKNLVAIEEDYIQAIIGIEPDA